jgi:GWxTD domain-containing protein
MNVRKFRGLAVLMVMTAIVALLSGPVVAGQSQKKQPPTLKESDLPKKYQEWLKLVSYIILPVERDVFLKLTMDRDRDIFIEAFWKLRDPTPDTPQNEFKDEHVRRFNYANQYYRRGTPREGWMTDMGRIYITLGAPRSIERFENVEGIHTCQVWYYYGDPATKLPAYFGLLFYQRGGSGEFKLYNPTSDGPTSLMVDTQGLDVTDYEKVYEKIRALAPTLATIAFSIIPGQYPYGFVPSPQNNFILAEIFESRRKNVNPVYATHFLDYKGIVSTEYMTNFVESTTRLAVIENPALGIAFLHFAVSPKKVSVDFYEPKGQYFCNFKLDVSLMKGATTVYQYSKDFPFYFPPDKADNIQANGLAVTDSFPVVGGTFALTILLQNSAGKEFTIYEKDVTIPGPAETPGITGQILGYKFQDYIAPVHAPFKIMQTQISIDPSDTLGLQDEIALAANLVGISADLWKGGEVGIAIKGLKATGAAQKNISVKLAAFPFRSTINFTHALPARDFPPDYYEATLSLKNAAGQVLDAKNIPFVISPAESVSHPVTLAKTIPLTNSFLFYYTLGYESGKIGEPRQAETYFERALSLKPDYLEGHAEYAFYLLGIGKFDRALEVAEPLKESDKLLFDHYLIRGLALAGLGKDADALVSLLEGNKIYNSDTRLLNGLGACFFRTKQKKEALDALQSSLRLNPDQPDIKALLARVEKELK